MDDATHRAVMALVLEASNAAAVLDAWPSTHKAIAAGLRTKANAAMDALREESWEPSETEGDSDA